MCLVPRSSNFWGEGTLSSQKHLNQHHIIKLSVSYKSKIVWSMFRFNKLAISLIKIFYVKNASIEKWKCRKITQHFSGFFSIFSCLDLKVLILFARSCFIMLLHSQKHVSSCDLIEMYLFSTTHVLHKCISTFGGRVNSQAKNN